MSLIRTDVVLGKQQNVVGSSDKDLILQTKGKVKVQQGSKFIDLIKDGKLNIPEIIEKYKSKSDFPNKTGFYYSEEDNLIYAVIDGNIIPINGEGSITELPEFIKKLDDLEDVIISNPSDGQYLTFKNGYWINGKLEYDKDDIKDIVDGVVDDVVNDVENKINYTYRGYKDIKETINMMFDPSGDYFTEFIRPIAIETAYIAVATESQQFNLFDIIFRPNKNGEEYNKNFWSWKTITGKEFGYLQHNTINKTWQIYPDLEHASNSFNGAAISSPKEYYIAHDLSKITLDGSTIPENKLDTTPFYVYARCNKEVLDDATFVVSTSQMTVNNDSDPNYYWFWVGVINSVTGEGDDAYRSFSCNFGFTEISGQYITTGVIKDPTGGSYWDMERGEFRLQYNVGLDDSGNPIYYPGIEFKPIRDAEGNVIDVELKVYGEIDAFSGTIGGIGVDNNHLYSISGNYGTMIYLNKDNKWDTIKYAPTEEGIEIQIPKYQRVYNQDEQKYTFEPVLNEKGEQVYDTMIWKGESEVFTSVDKYIEDVKNYILNNSELFPVDSSAYSWANDFENSNIGKGTHVPMFTNKGLIISQDGDIIGPDYFLTSDANKRPSFFRGNLIIVDDEGNDISLKQYIITVGSYFDWINEGGKNYIIPKLYYGEDLSIHSRGDVVAYSTEEHDLKLPIASSNALGAIKVGSGLTITEDGTVSVTSGSGGSGKAEWGYITGTLSNQTDLWAELQKKANTSDLNISNWNAAYNSAHTHSNKSYLDVIDQSLSTFSSPNFRNLTTDLNIVASQDIYANNKMYTQTLQAYTSVITKDVIASGNVKAQGDVIAYSTGTASAPFKYWRPSVNSSGVLSWTNSTSETTPTSVNIKGPKGDRGEDGKNGATFNGGTITNNLTVSRSGGVAVLGLYGYHTTWQAAQIQLVNNGFTDYRHKWTIDLAGSSEQNGDLCFQNYNSQDKGSPDSQPWYRMKIFKHGTATNAVAAAGAYVNNSDERLKNVLYSYHNKPQTMALNSTENSTESNLVLDKLKNLEAKYFYWKIPDNANDEEKELAFYNTIQLGFIAQDVEVQFPEFVTEDNGFKQLNYAGLGSFIAVEGCRELDQKIEQQQTEIQSLKEKITQLETIINEKNNSVIS